jgi:hypothetical protein
MVLLFRFDAVYEGNIGMEGHSFSDAYGLLRYGFLDMIGSLAGTRFLWWKARIFWLRCRIVGGPGDRLIGSDWLRWRSFSGE